MYLDFLFTSLLINIILYLPAYYYQTDTLTDMSYALTFMLLSIKAFLMSDFSSASWILLLMHLFWSLRLGSYLGLRIHVMKKDNRFDKMRNNKWQFLGFWVLQAITVYLVMLPGILFFNSTNTGLNISMLVGFIVWLTGLIIESIADYQKMNFFKVNDHKKCWINTGLWYYSRHPNYFGEIMVWLGTYIFVVYSLTDLNKIIALISPVFISFLLIFVSGIPLLEKSAQKKFGHIIDYQKYKSSTNLLIPFFKK